MSTRTATGPDGEVVTFEVDDGIEDHEHRFTERWYYMDGPTTMVSLRCEDCFQHQGPAAVDTDHVVAVLPL